MLYPGEIPDLETDDAINDAPGLFFIALTCMFYSAVHYSVSQSTRLGHTSEVTWCITYVSPLIVASILCAAVHKLGWLRGPDAVAQDRVEDYGEGNTPILANHRGAPTAVG